MIMRISGPILVATDLSDAAAEALRRAADLARDLGSTLLICHILPELPAGRMFFPRDAGRNAAHQAELEEKAAIVVGAHVDDIIGSSHEHVAIRIDFGSAHSRIRDPGEANGQNPSFGTTSPTEIRALIRRSSSDGAALAAAGCQLSRVGRP